MGREIEAETRRAQRLGRVGRPRAPGRLAAQLMLCAFCGASLLSGCRWVGSFEASERPLDAGGDTKVEYPERGLTVDLGPAREGGARDGMLVEGALAEAGAKTDGPTGADDAQRDAVFPRDLQFRDGHPLTDGSPDGARDAAREMAAPPDSSAPVEASIIVDARSPDGGGALCQGWAFSLRPLRTAGSVIARAVAVAPEASTASLRTVVVGTFSGTMMPPDPQQPASDGSGCGLARTSEAAHEDIFVLALDERGKCLWLRTISSPGKDEVYDVALASGLGSAELQVAVAGQLGTDKALADSLSGASPPGYSPAAGFIFAYDETGATGWSLQLRPVLGSANVRVGNSEVRTVAFAELPLVSTSPAEPMVVFGAQYKGSLEAVAGKNAVRIGPEIGVATNVSFAAVALSAVRTITAADRGSHLATEFVPHHIRLVPIGGVSESSGIFRPRVAVDTQNKRVVLAVDRNLAAEGTLCEGDCSASIAIRSWVTPTAGNLMVIELDPATVLTASSRSHTLALAGDQRLVDLAVDSRGEVYLAATFDSATTVDTAGGGKINLVPQGQDALVLKLVPTLDGIEWAARLGGRRADYPASLGWATSSPGSGPDRLQLAGAFGPDVVKGASAGPEQLCLAEFVAGQMFDPRCGTNTLLSSAANDHVFDPRTGGVVVVGSFEGGGPFLSPGGQSSDGTAAATSASISLLCP